MSTFYLLFLSGKKHSLDVNCTLLFIAYTYSVCNISFCESKFLLCCYRSTSIPCIYMPTNCTFVSREPDSLITIPPLIPMKKKEKNKKAEKLQRNIDLLFTTFLVNYNWIINYFKHYCYNICNTKYFLLSSCTSRPQILSGLCNSKSFRNVT